MCGRNRRPVIHSDYLEGQKDIDAWFMEEYGLTEEELNEYDEQKGTAGTIDRYEIEYNGTTYVLFADKALINTEDEEDEEDEEVKKEVCEWLKELSLEDLKEIWNNVGYKESIKALIRYPGGMHEWLMVALVPVFKEMELDMELLKRCRTPTNECSYYEDEGKENLIWKHGGKGSTQTHNLLKEIYMSSLSEANSPDGSRRILADKLMTFKEEYCRNGNTGGLDTLIESL